MVDKSNFKPIIHIAAIPREESVNIHLVAITHTGILVHLFVYLLAIGPFLPYG